MNRSTAQALSALRNVSPAQVAAMRTMEDTDPAALSALSFEVQRLCRSEHVDVMEHAVIVSAALYLGTPGDPDADGVDMARVVHAASVARMAARRTVALAHAEDTYGMSEDADALLYGDAPASSVAMPDAVRADARLRITYADVVATVRGGVALVDSAACAGLDRAADDYLRHAASECEACATRPGRRPTLTGITAHVEGWDGTDSAFHRSRRATVRALSAVPGHGAVAECGHPRTDDKGRPTGHDKGSCAPALPAWDALSAMLGDPAPMATMTTGRNSAASGDRTPSSQRAPYSTVRHARTVTATVRTVGTVTTPARTVAPDAAQSEARASAAWDRATDRTMVARRALSGASLHADADGYLRADAAHADAVIAEARAHAAMRAARVAPARRTVTTDAARYGAVVVTLAPESMPYPVGAYDADTGAMRPVVATEAGARWVSEAEADTVAAPRSGRRAPERIGTHDGEGATAPSASAQAPTFEPVRSGKVPVSPRKKAGAGQTGPTTTAHLATGRAVDSTDADRARTLAAAWRAGTPRA